MEWLFYMEKIIIDISLVVQRKEMQKRKVTGIMRISLFFFLFLLFLGMYMYWNNWVEKSLGAYNFFTWSKADDSLVSTFH